MNQPYRRFFEALPGYCTVQDRDFMIVEANQRFRKDFGDYQGRHCYQIYKQRSEKCEICPVERTFRDGQDHSGEEQVTCTDGRCVSVIVYTTPIRDENGEIAAVMEMSTDITEMKSLQRQMRESQERYRMLFEEVPCYISIQDRELNIIEANRKFKEDFGSFLGCKCYQVYKHRDRQCLDCTVQETFRDGRVHHSEEVVSSKSGKKNVLVYTAPLHGPDGNIKSVMEMSADITPIRELQGKLESVGLLISSISHGIKGLLTGLDGGMYLVDTGLKMNKPERLNKGWGMVQRNVERIRSLVLNILYYAKDREPVFEKIVIGELAEEVIEVIKHKASELGIQVSSEVDQACGEMLADRNGLRALLVNLLENSLDACRVDTKNDMHGVRLRVSPESLKILFEIEDNGIGMDREACDKAFSLFYSSKGTEGTGLGLFIADKIVRAQGGTIEIESRPGEGTRFLVRIPSGPVKTVTSDNPLEE
ncbi:MAG TPA: PAS domain-containing sensor histidine kinase [Myxococcota bacterium]|nr:PAS domain-containing sensor histidine kinase [Myxococcota bacterium]